MKLERILKKLSNTVTNEMGAMSPTDLEKTIIQGEEAIEAAAKELDDNPQYQAAKEAAKDLSCGLREVRAYQRAKIAYALHLLREGGKI